MEQLSHINEGESRDELGVPGEDAGRAIRSESSAETASGFSAPIPHAPAHEPTREEIERFHMELAEGEEDLLTEQAMCSHEIVEFGRCAGCGHSIDYGDYEPVRYDRGPVHGCDGKGWYHDGSEQEAALAEGRSPKPCPYGH